MEQYLIVCPLLFLAGFIDAIAGGGGLISLPACMLAGLPVHLAIGTNKLSVLMGEATSTVQYARSGYVNWKRALVGAGVTLIASMIGANLSLLIPDRIFQIIMLILLPLIAIYVLRAKSLEEQKTEYSEVKTMVLYILIAFVMGVYGGFYGPGTGTFLLLLLTGAAHVSLREAAGTTKVINFVVDLVSIIIFSQAGQVLLPLGLTAGVFSMAGNYIGARFFTQKGAKFVKPLICVVLVIFFIKIIYGLL